MKKTLFTITAIAALTTASFAVDTTACVACHGANFEKVALGKSKIVKDMNKDDIIKALKGYKDGTYGGAMKAMMTGQVTKLSEADIMNIADQITGGSTAAAPKAEAEKKVETPKVDAEKKIEDKANAANVNSEKKVEEATDTAKKVVETTTKKVEEKATQVTDAVKRPVHKQRF